MLPPLSPTPHLSRLLIPGETILYAPKLHPLYGWPTLLLILALFTATLLLASQYGPIWLLGLVPAGLLTFIHSLPFQHFEMAITTHRLLLRYGRFSITLNDIPPEHIDHIQLNQTPLSSLLHAGHLTLNLRKGNTLVPLTFPWLWHPFTTLEALQALQHKPGK